MNAYSSSPSIPSGTSGTPLLQLSELSLTLADKALLQQVNFSLEDGECLAIIGPSGAGKSSLLQVLAGISPGKVQGRFERFGESASVAPDSRIGLLPQGLADNLNPHMTVAEHLQDGLSLHFKLSRRERWRRVQKLARQVALPGELLQRYPRHLSGGEIQRVLLALALLGDPQILLLDEPTAALDAQTGEQIRQLLQAQTRVRSIVLVTHDMSLAQQLADRVVLMQRGRIVQQGSVEQVLPASGGQYQPAVPVVTGHAPVKDEPAPVLELRHLHLGHRGRTLFSDFQLRLARGSLTLVYGASGCGKTSLARLLAGWEYLPPGAELDVRGRCLLLSQHARAACAGHFTLRQILTEPLMLAGRPVDLARVRYWLQQVRLPDSDAFMRRHPSGLSGGELQRLLLARAMLAEPDLLIADEPTSALDPALREEIVTLLLGVQKVSGCTLLIFTHDRQLSRLTGVPGHNLTPSGLIRK